MWRRRREHLAALLLPLLLCPVLAESNLEQLNKIPPNIYRWIEENAHICTVVPANGESLVNFLSVEEGAKCLLCPELGAHDIPGMACAVEVSPNDIDVEIGCHPLPELCVLELKTRYAEFYANSAPVGLVSPPAGMGNPPLPTGNPPGPPGGRTEEEIFQATGNIFTESEGSNQVDVSTERTAEASSSEEEGDQEEGEEDSAEERIERKDVFETEATPRRHGVTLTTTTTIRANAFAMPSPQVEPVNLTMQEISTRAHTAASMPQNWGGGEIEVAMPAGSPAGPKKLMIKRRKEEDGLDSEAEGKDGSRKGAAVCKDTHELCCFWAMAGECDSNPFWMRVKCARTCGTCGCKVKSADKCVSMGVKCALTTSPTPPPSTPTTTRTPSTTSASTTVTTTPSTTTPTTTAPTEPPTPSRRRPRPTPPVQMPGHRPQKPRQRGRKTTTATATMSTAVAESQTVHYSEEAEQQRGVGVGGGSAVNSVGIGPRKQSGAGDDKARGDQKRAEAEQLERKLQNWLMLVGYGDDIADARVGVPSIVRVKSPTTAAPSTTAEPSTAITFASCFNYHKLCDFWAKMGECTNNPFWMRPHCQLACRSCGESLGDISTPPPRPGCNNEHILCPFWAFIGECARNPRWMNSNCRASCLLC